MGCGQVWLTVCPLHPLVVIILYNVDWQGEGRNCWPRSLRIHESLYCLYLVSAHEDILIQEVATDGCQNNGPVVNIFGYKTEQKHVSVFRSTCREVKKQRAVVGDLVRKS